MAPVKRYRPRQGGRKRRRTAIVTVARPIRGAMPSQLKTQLLYGARESVTGLFGNHVYTGNGLFDPDISGVGHQPRGFDQLMALYDHYTVQRVKVELRFINAGGDNTEFGVMYCLAADGSGPPTTISDILEHQNAKIVPYNWEGNATVRTLTKEFDTSTNLSTKDYSVLRGDASSNPTEQYFVHFGCVGTGGSSNSVICYTTLTYYATFSEPKTPGES